MGAESLRVIKQEEAMVEDCDEGDMDNIWDITVKEVPLIPFPNKVNVVREKEPDNDVVNYVAPATKSILDELLEEFGDEILNVTMVDEEAECNPTKDIEELERLLAKDPQSYFTEIHVHSVMVKTNEKSKPFIRTQQLSPLYGVIKSFKSSGNPCKVEREMKSRFNTWSGARMVISCKEAFQARLIGCYTIDDDDLLYDYGCCSRKQTWIMLSFYHTEQI
ncbi:hypothetical protein Tco_1086058 [Tanacetum coccineum]